MPPHPVPQRGTTLSPRRERENHFLPPLSLVGERENQFSPPLSTHGRGQTPFFLSSPLGRGDGPPSVGSGPQGGGEGFCNPLPQRLSLKELHGNEGLTFVLAKFVNRADVGMIQAEAARASRSKRSRAVRSFADSSGRNFKATVRPNLMSSALYSTPFPRRPASPARGSGRPSSPLGLQPRVAQSCFLTLRPFFE